jgi:hypothetical protein
VDNLEGYVTLRTAAEGKGIPYTTLKGWVQRGVVPSIKLGRDRLVKMEDVNMIAMREEGRPRTLTVTPPGLPLQTWANLKEHLLDARTPERVREAYDKLVEYYQRPGVLRTDYLGAPQTAARAAWTAINAYLPTLPEEQVRLIVPVLDQTVRERKEHG